VHRLATRYENWYLLESGGRLTVLDAGLPGQWAEFAAALSRLGYTPADIEAVLITHHHPDHAGNAERLRSSGARVLSHPADSAYLRGERRTSRSRIVGYLWHPWFAVYMRHLLANGVTRVPGVARLDELADGEVLDVPGHPRAILTPGHTSGMCSFELSSAGILVVGDALCNGNTFTGRPGVQILARCTNMNSEQALESLGRIEAVNAGMLLFGHGEPWSGSPAEAVAQAREAGPS
jgi:glyoxylase-like metal-dependent hydrolase (beta-lactamase superfamily II)